ncbi:inositol monophosphatase family protein [Paraburkholderia sp. SARCC-3016]|uniref:inositol monophosphatase family protein n=1 Tax=Paraburkholderia sp. SARCC-3016 TaxID=3058611 RepID=UPI002806988C|nr:inositol monophosphatase family protein [Paraburkholderia sp. SARCC-3016]MDQ7979824.1 inositol monophosphatase family protein [Paraburkholderia sp. SARCC-3016]
MTDVQLHHRYLAACAIAREAGRLIRLRFERRDEALTLKFKGPQDYLTETDAEVERLIAARIAESFPDDDFFGEEGGGSFGRDVWIVDPIDGTADFARGVPHFCVSIAFVRDGRAEIGVLYDPMLDELFAARRGAGATLNGAPIKVSTIADIGQSVVELGWSSRIPFEGFATVQARLQALGAGVKRRGSGALGIAYVAMGRQDAYCELHINSWDAAAAVLLVEEAGGWANDFLTPDCLRNGNRVIVCTPALREHIEQAMAI